MLTTTKRHRRIERRCIPAVVEALHAGQIGARSADVFLQLTPSKQRAELTRRLNEARQRGARHRLVSDAIRSYLDGLNGQHVDLVELSKIIKKALAA